MNGTRGNLDPSPYTSHVLLDNTTDTPKNDALVRYLADKYTALRVAGLEQSPESFSATLQDELRLTLDEKINRILILNKNILVIVKWAAGSTPSEGPWYDDEWVGQATLFGPMTWNEYVSPMENTHANVKLLPNQVQLLDSPKNHVATKTSYWHMAALYIDVNHRRLGLAKKLCLASFDYIKNLSKQEGYKTAVLRIIIKPTNTVVLDMYKGLGFEVVDGALSTLAEAAYCAGDQEMLPSDYDELKAYSTRGGIFMLKTLDVIFD